jgi:methylthioribose-1-phosphate isomerase
VQELGKQLGNLKDKEKKEEKKKKEEEIKSTNKQIERLKAHRPEVVELKTTFDKLKAARLHYRVYIEFTDGQNKPAKVTLMSSDANTVGNQPVQ